MTKSAEESKYVGRLREEWFLLDVIEDIASAQQIRQLLYTEEVKKAVAYFHAYSVCPPASFLIDLRRPFTITF